MQKSAESLDGLVEQMLYEAKKLEMRVEGLRKDYEGEEEKREMVREKWWYWIKHDEYMLILYQQQWKYDIFVKSLPFPHQYPEGSLKVSVAQKNDQKHELIQIQLMKPNII